MSELRARTSSHDEHIRTKSFYCRIDVVPLVNTSIPSLKVLYTCYKSQE